MNKPLKIVSIGGGWVSNTRHIPALKRSGLYEVVGAVSKHPDRAERTAKQHQLAHYATEVDFSPSWMAEADAVMVGSNPQAHFEVIKACLQAGKHVLTEKPMIMDSREAGELVKLAEQQKRVLAVVHNFQFSRASQCLRKDLASGRLGKIRAVYGVQLCNHARNIHDWCDQLPLGLFFDEAPHFYYMLRWIGGGELEFLNASVWEGKGRNTPRMVSGEYRSGDIPLYLHINFDSSITEWHITVVGEKGVADLDLWRDIYIYLPNDGVHSAKDITKTSILTVYQHLMGVWTGGWRYVAGRHLYGNVDVVTRFHRAIHGEDCLAGMNAAEGRRVVEMMHEIIDKSARH